MKFLKLYRKFASAGLWLSVGLTVMPDGFLAADSITLAPLFATGSFQQRVMPTHLTRDRRLLNQGEVVLEDGAKQGAGVLGTWSFFRGEARLLHYDTALDFDAGSRNAIPTDLDLLPSVVGDNRGREKTTFGSVEGKLPLDYGFDLLLGLQGQRTLTDFQLRNLRQRLPFEATEVEFPAYAIRQDLKTVQGRVGLGSDLHGSRITVDLFVGADRRFRKNTLDGQGFIRPDQSFARDYASSIAFSGGTPLVFTSPEIFQTSARNQNTILGFQFGTSLGQWISNPPVVEDIRWGGEAVYLLQDRTLELRTNFTILASTWWGFQVVGQYAENSNRISRDLQAGPVFILLF